MAGGSNASLLHGVATASDPGSPTAVQSAVCVECGRQVELLFRQYTRGIRLGRCDYCRSVADKYIEWEFVLIAIDLALHRIQAYRHLLFNRKPFSTHSFQGRLWQLGVAMAALDAHLRHTALSSEPPTANPSCRADGGMDTAAGGRGAAAAAAGGDPFWEAGGLLLAAVIEHACFATGAVLCARRGAASRHRRALAEGRNNVDPAGERGVVTTGGVRGGDADSPSRGWTAGAGAAVSPPPPRPSTTKMYMALVYPLFFRLLAAFVMIWDRQVAILNTIELLVATMQFVALSAVVGGLATVGSGGTVGGMPEGRVAAATAVVAGLAAKMGARAALCRYLGMDARTLTML